MSGPTIVRGDAALFSRPSLFSRRPDIARRDTPRRAHVLGRGLSRAGLAIAVSLLVWGGELGAQTRPDTLNGLWSKDLDTCSLSEDEDETRLIVEDRELRDYTEACRIVSRSVQADRSVLVLLQCPKVAGVRTMRVFPRSSEKAVFYLPDNKRPRSRDMIRCPKPPPEPPVATEATEAWTKIRDPRRLIKLWLDARQRCRLPGTPGRQEACTERRQIGSLLRDMRLCHYTKGSREGWQACS